MAVEKAIPAAKQRFRRECHVVKRSSVSSDRFHAMKNLIDNAQNSDNFVQQALGILSPLSSWTFPDMNHELKAGDGKVTQSMVSKTVPFQKGPLGVHLGFGIKFKNLKCNESITMDVDISQLHFTIRTQNAQLIKMSHQNSQLTNAESFHFNCSKQVTSAEIEKLHQASLKENPSYSLEQLKADVDEFRKSHLQTELPKELVYAIKEAVWRRLEVVVNNVTIRFA